MLYHNIVNSDEKRKSKTIVEKQEQRRHQECWFGNLVSEAAEIGIQLEKKCVDNIMKSKWKKHVKDKLSKAFNDTLKVRRMNMNKLRFLQTKCIETFFKTTFNDDLRTALMIRLNVVEVISKNFGLNKNCGLCGDAEDSTEHLFLCSGLDHHDLSIDNLSHGTRMGEVVALFREMEGKRRERLINEIIVNSNILFREEDQLINN